MSEPRDKGEPRRANFEAWEARAEGDLQTLEERRATEIFLAALGLTPTFSNKVFLKGGILVGAVYESWRNTADLDFSTTLEPAYEFPDRLKEEIEAAIPVATAKLGFPSKILKLQSVTFRPRKDSFVDSNTPGLEVKFAYADAGSKQQKKVEAGQGANVIYADISFNEPIESVEEICIDNTGLSFFAYTKCDLIAEKLRSLLQQKIRQRNRRQDVFDLHYIIAHYDVSEEEKASIANTFKIKCAARDIFPAPDSFEDKEVRERAQADWHTLQSEVPELPDFDEAFEIVHAFYRSLSL